MKRKYIISIVLLIFFFILFYNLDTVRNTVKKYLPLKTKTLIREFVLGKEKMEKVRKLQEYAKMNYNQKVLPETQFTNIYMKKILLNNLKSISIKFFMEEFNDDLIIIDHKGKVFFIDKQFVLDSKNLNWSQVDTNLNSNNVRIKDVLVLNDEIYISYMEFASETNECVSMNISKAKMSKEKIKFEIFFTSNNGCQNFAFNAGRMVFYNHDDKDGLLFTTTAECNFNNQAQDDYSLNGKTLFIDLNTRDYIIFSKGHRNPQGLTIYNGLILSAEHGPVGGDEINLIEYGKNYGWATSSYGEIDTCLEKTADVYEYSKSHSKHGFTEPLYSFVPSIGINQIIKVPENFSEYWQNNFLVTSLEGRTIYRILFDDNFSKVLYKEKIFIGKRMRDIMYLEEFNVFLLALEASYDPGDSYPSIGILSTNLK